MLLAVFLAVASPSLTSTRDPNAAVVVVEDLKASGFAIANAQQLANVTVRELKKRVGAGGVVYGGVANAQKRMVKLVGDEGGFRAKLIDYYDAATQNTAYSVRIKYGTKRKRSFIKYKCVEKKSGKTVDGVHIKAKSFREALDKAKTALATFCSALDPEKPKAEAPKKKDKEWRMPPRR